MQNNIYDIIYLKNSYEFENKIHKIFCKLNTNLDETEKYIRKLTQKAKEEVNNDNL